MRLKVQFLSLVFTTLFYSVFTQTDTTQNGVLQTFQTNSINQYIYKKGNAGGVILHTNGWGINYRHSRFLTYKSSRSFNIDLINYKDNKETKVQHPNTGQSKKYVFGKTNSLTMLKVSYGRTNVIGEKIRKGGAEISYTFFYGPSLAFVKPIYYKVLYQDKNNPKFDSLSIEDFDPKTHTRLNIVEKAGYFDGISKSRLILGGHLNITLSVENSKNNELISNLEFGANIDAFPDKIEILSNGKKSYYFANLFVRYQLGKRTLK